MLILRSVVALPAIQAVKKQAKFPASIDLRASTDRSSVEKIQQILNTLAFYESERHTKYC